MQIRETKNEGYIIGKLKSMNLEEKLSKTGKTMIMGDLTVVVTEGEMTSEHRVKLLKMKLNKDGSENKMYKSILTCMNTYKTIDNDGEELATKVRVEGNLEMNDYYNKNNGEVVSSTSIRCNVFKSAKETDAECAMFAFEGVISKVIEEYAGDNPTGRLKVELLGFNYKKEVVPVQAIVEANMIEAFGAYYQIGQLATLSLAMRNGVKTSQQEQPTVGGFGVQVTIAKNNRVRENIIIGGTPAEIEGFEVADIQEALKTRMAMLDSLEAESQANAPVAPQQGFGMAAPNFGTQQPQGTPMGFGGVPAF